MCSKLGHAKFQPSKPKKTFSNWELDNGGSKNVRFQRKTGPISKTVKDRA